MIDDRERAIAYVTGRISTLSKARLIQEMDTGRLFVMSGDVTENRVHIYDLQSRGYVAGSKSAGRWNLFHARDNATIDLIPTEPGRFGGLDHSSGRWFAVTVTGRISVVKDLVPGRTRRYSL